MDNRVYYGQYSLKHWLDLILKGNIILPDYQRYFVWDEDKVKTLITTLRKREFVPPITIGAFKEDGVNQNLILDGQQRLTSILLAYLGLYPDPTTFKATRDLFVNDNDDDEDETEPSPLDDILNWDFRQLTKKGKSKESIHAQIIQGNYKYIDFGIDEAFLKYTFLGFSYLVPQTDDQHLQQKYYSSVFRNINVQGQSLLPQESRASLYFLNKDLKDFFDPPFIKELTIKTVSGDNKADFVRFVSLLSQLAKDGHYGRLARGFKPQMEKYYEDYIYSAVGDHSSNLFKPFSQIFTDNNYRPKLDNVATAIKELEIPKQYMSIIEMDTFLFGLLHVVLFENRTIDVTRKIELIRELRRASDNFRADERHRKAPAALKYLKTRMETSITIYHRYSHG